MDQKHETEAEPRLDDQDVEGHSLLAEAQGRELIARRSREMSDSIAHQRGHSKKSSRPSRLRRLLGG